MRKCTGRITVGEGQAEYPREAVLKEVAGTWPGERALESGSGARGLVSTYLGIW